MNNHVDLTSLSGVWLGRVYALHGELSWRLRWELRVGADGRVSGSHLGLGGWGQKSSAAIQGFAEQAAGGAGRLKLGYRDEEGREFVHELELSGDGRRTWLTGHNTLSSSRRDESLGDVLEPGRVELWRETATEAEHTRTKQGVREAVRALMPAGARPKVSVVGTRRLDEDRGWEAYVRLVYLKARARQAREITARAEGPTGRRAMKKLLAALVHEGHARRAASPGRAQSAARGAPRDLLARYEAGDHAVWQHLLDEADEVLRHPERRAEAGAVARALMGRVRQNRDHVRAALVEAGAKLAPEAPLARAEDLEAVESLGGSLPIALDAFWRVVGSIALVPGPGTPYEYGRCSLEQTGIRLLSLDPLWLAGANEVGASLDAYRDAIESAAPEPAGPLDLELSPDYLHKQNISGGAPYSVRLPSASAREAIDPTLHEERHQATLVGYLRLAFASGGFPLRALASGARSTLAANDRVAFAGVKGSWARAAERLRARLCRDLLPF